MPTKMQNLYTGMSGHLGAMSEFLSLGYNVAIPEVDRGDDVFVVRDDDGDLSRIQVKTANARTTQYGYRAMVAVPMLQLEIPKDPESPLRFCCPPRQKLEGFRGHQPGRLVFDLEDDQHGQFGRHPTGQAKTRNPAGVPPQLVTDGGC